LRRSSQTCLLHTNNKRTSDCFERTNIDTGSDLIGTAAPRPFESHRALKRMRAK